MIVNFGEFGTKFYIIIDGTVNVRIPTEAIMECKFKEYDDFVEKNKYYIIEHDEQYLKMKK